MPDTFASRQAALQETFADSSVGNINGSNAVNVFLGLGLPWLIAAIYWAAKVTKHYRRTDAQAKQICTFGFASNLNWAQLIGKKYCSSWSTCFFRKGFLAKEANRKS